jgi:hypothetical protein
LRYQRAKGVIQQKTIHLSAYDNPIQALEVGFDDLSCDETMLVVGKLGKLYELNITGAIIWCMLDDPKSYQSICEELSRHFFDYAGIIPDEVQRFLSFLVKAKLLEELGPEM